MSMSRAPFEQFHSRGEGLARSRHHVPQISVADLRHVHRLAEILTCCDFEAYLVVLAHASLAQEQVGTCISEHYSSTSAKDDKKCYQNRVHDGQAVASCVKDETVDCASFCAEILSLMSR